MTYENPWIYKNKPFLETDVGDYIGFVYLITEISTGRKYIGKKIFFNKISKPPLKGKTRRRIAKKYSDWQTYYSSSDEIKAIVAEHGSSDYKREIIRLCSSKAEMAYFETKEIFARDALLKEEYINKWVSSRIQRNQLRSVIV